MKRIIVSFLIVLCTFSVFAAKQTVSVKCAPIATQISTSSAEPVYKIQSDYGIGAEASYRRYLNDSCYAEGGIAWNAFLLPDGRPDFTSLMAFAGAGYDLRLTDMFAVKAHADVALDTLLYDKLISPTITIKTGAELAMDITEKVAFALGCDGTFGFAQKTKTDYRNYRILPTVGMSVDL